MNEIQNFLISCNYGPRPIGNTTFDYGKVSVGNIKVVLMAIISLKGNKRLGIENPNQS